MQLTVILFLRLIICEWYTPCLKKRPTFGLLQLWQTWTDFDIFFGRSAIDKVSNQKTLYYATSNNSCFCTTWQNRKDENCIFDL